MIKSQDHKLSKMLKKLRTFEEIKDVGQKKLEMQWVCSKREKHHGLKVGHEANLIIKGSND